VGLLHAAAGVLRVAVVVPTDPRNLAWRCFYGFWSLVGMARTSSRVALVISGDHGGTVAAIAGAGALLVPVIGLGMAGIESIVVVADFVETLAEKRQTSKALENALRKQREAVGALSRHGRDRGDELSEARCAEGGAAQHYPTSPLLPSPVPARQVMATDFPDEASAAAHRLAAWHAQHDVLKRAARDAILDATLAAARDRNQRTDVLEAGLTLSRDTVVQGGLVGSAIAQTLKEFALDVAVVMKQAVLASQILAFALGASQIATGLVGLWRAVRDWRRQDRAITTFSASRLRLQATADGQLSRRERSHQRRIDTPLGKATLRTYEDTRRGLAAGARRAAIWSALRIGYGAGSVSIGIASMLVLAGASGGAALPVLAAALGTAWLAFAVYKLIVRKRAKARERQEAAAFDQAMHDIARESGFACTLVDCPLDRLASLAPPHGESALGTNKYYRAALLARYLHIDDEAAKNDDHAMKTLRGQASAALQTMGVPRKLTQMLKRSSVQSTYSWILSYLSEDNNRALTAIGHDVLAAVKVDKD
jgi:hypothetical protein